MSPLQRNGACVLAILLLATGSACAQNPAPAARGPNCPEDGPPQLNLPREQVSIATAKGPVRFNVQVAVDEQTQAKGLMFRRSMPDDDGMIFDFGAPRPTYFWMHNTYMPLDLLFVDVDGDIVNIAARNRPCDDTPIPSAGPIRAVIEINSGLAEKLGIRPGDRVTSERIFAAR